MELHKHDKLSEPTSVNTALTVSNTIVEDLSEVTTDPCLDPRPQEDMEDVCTDKITLAREDQVTDNFP